MDNNINVKNTNQPEQDAEQLRRKQLEIAREQQKNARLADESEQNSPDATVSTFILPGD